MWSIGDSVTDPRLSGCRKVGPDVCIYIFATRVLARKISTMGSSAPSPRPMTAGLERDHGDSKMRDRAER